VLLTATLVYLPQLPGPAGYGARLLWAGNAPEPLYTLKVTPGDARLRRGGDQLIEALPGGFAPGSMVLRIRTASSGRWELLRMEPRAGQPGFSILLAGVAEEAEYQVDAGRLRSPIHKLTVVDLPGIQRVRVTYQYPAHLALARRTEDPGGDLRAVAGTVAEVEVYPDKPLKEAFLQLDNGTRLPLEPAGGALRARVPIQTDGSYYVAALDQGQPVRLTQDFFIEARADDPPTVRIASPGRDAKVSPIEEVPIEIAASDDYALRQVTLHYSVNGGPEKTIALAAQPHNTTQLALEEFHLKPGDILGLYATARDATSTAQTDIFFLEAQPYEREYSQAQSDGGQQGGEGDQENEISQRQKEIISATWNQLKRPRPRAQAEEEALFLSGVQDKLGAQAKSLAERMRSRELATTNEEFQSFTKEMKEASADMTEAAQTLKSGRFREALAPEQRALQHLLRADATMRQIQVAFGQRGGGGGGGGGAMRDLESLFDLELDKEKNQYETASSRASSQQDRAADEALKRLEELARRQQELAQRQQRNPQQQADQRWAQEQLRREAEELRRQMEQLERGQSGNPQQGQSGSPQQGQSGSQQASAQQSGSPRSSASETQRLSAARQNLERALEQMRRAQSTEAAERMAEARDQLRGLRREQTGSQLEELSRQAAAVTEGQRQYEQNLRRAYPPQESGKPAAAAPAPQALERMAQEKEALARQYQRLEQSMKDAARAAPQGASERLREALGDAQQGELALRFKLGSDWVRRGMGPYIAPREHFLTSALEQLQEKLNEARQAAAQGTGDGRQRQALEQLAQLREQLARQAGNGENDARQQRAGSPRGPQSNDEPGRGQQGRETDPRNSQRRDGSAAGSQGREGAEQGEPRNGGDPRGPGRAGEPRGQQGDPRGQQAGGASGGQGREGGALSRQQQEGLRAAIRQLEDLNQADPETGAQRVLRDLHTLTAPGFSPETLRQRLNQEILPQLEQLELRLRSRLDAAQGARQSTPPPAPPGYGAAVAEYYRRLGRKP